MGKVIEKKNQKYQTLISSAFELFELKDFNSVSIDDIVKKAGVAKGTFYLYFKDKLDLASAVILKKAKEYLYLDADIPEITNYKEFEISFRHYIDYLSDFLEKNKTLTLLIDKNVNLCVEAVIEHREGTIKELYDKIFTFLNKSGIGEEEAEIKMYIYINTVVASCCNAILRGKPYSLKVVKENLYDIVTMSIKNIIAVKECGA